MANVILDSLAQVIEVEGKEYPVSTDFRDWMDFSITISKRHLTGEDFRRAILMVLPGGVPRTDSDALANALLGFFHNKEPEPKRDEKPKLMRDQMREELEREEAERQPRIICYEQDAGLILAAFWQVYSIDLTSVQLHWHVFKALIDALPDECKLRKVMGYRSLGPSDYSKMGKAEAKHYRDMQRIYALPDERTQDEIDADFAAGL